MPLIATLPEDVDAAFLAAALDLDAAPSDLRVSPVGTGQMGTCVRAAWTGSDGDARSVLVKLPAADPAARALVAGAYATEVRFYTELAPTLAVRVPTCHLAALGDDGAFTLVLEDLAPRVQGDQIAGCTAAQARAAAVNLAGLHGPRWCDPSLEDVEGLGAATAEDAAMLAELYGPTTDLFLDAVGDLLTTEDAATLRACGAVIADWSLARPERFAPVHGDYRLDNLLFAPPEQPDLDVVAVDWQTVSRGLPARDLAYLLGTGLEPTLRARVERDIVEAYRAALGTHGVDLDTFTAEQAWDDYRLAMLQGPLVTVFGCAYGTRTERGDRMFAAMASRSAAAIRALGSLALAAHPA